MSAVEDRVAHLLSSLPGEWRPVRDVRWPGRPYATIGHLVVGPAGVFVIDSPSWTGTVRVTAGVLREDGCRRERAVSSAADAALAVSEAWPVLATVPVTPMICVDREERVLGLSGDVVVCSTANVITFLLSRPAVLDDEEVHALADRLLADRVLTRLERAGAAVPRLSARPAPSPRSARSRRAAGTAAVLALVALAALGWAAQLGVGERLGGRLGELGSRVVERLGAPTSRMGQTMAVPGGGVRPDLAVTVRRPRVIEPSLSGPPDPHGQVLVAVPATIHNLGRRAWVSDLTTEPLLVDESEGVHAPDEGYADARAGRVLSTRTAVDAGATVQGVWVFAVPRGTQLSGVRLRVGPEAATTVRWTLGSQHLRAR